MSTGTSTFIIRWINFLTMLLAVAVLGFGVWMHMHHDSCRKSLSLPVLGLGAIIFLISIIGFLGALKKSSILLWIYLIMLFIVLVAILVFTVLAFIVTNNGSGHTVNGLKYKEYELHDYSLWFLKRAKRQLGEFLTVCAILLYGIITAFTLKMPGESTHSDKKRHRQIVLATLSVFVLSFYLIRVTVDSLEDRDRWDLKGPVYHHQKLRESTV